MSHLEKRVFSLLSEEGNAAYARCVRMADAALNRGLAARLRREARMAGIHL
jgi:hypothetical protein